MDVKFTDRSGEALEALAAAKLQALEAIGLVAEGYAKEETPVDTGRLRNSIAHAVKDNAAYIGTNVEYAPYVEFGSVHNRAHHMLKNAAEGHGDEYREIVKTAMKGGSPT